MEGKPMKCCMSWLWALISVCIQFFLIFTTHEYINREKAIPFKPIGEVERMTSRLSFALKSNSTLDAVEDDALIKLCNGQPNPVFFTLVVFLWSTKMLGELNSVRSFYSQINNSRPVYTREETVEERDNMTLIVGLKCVDKVVMNIFLVVPKAMIAISLWIVGAEFMVFTRDMENLILKALALHFIIMTDELIFESFLSPVKKDVIRKTKVVEVEGWKSRAWRSWQGELVKLVMVVLLVVSLHLFYTNELLFQDICWTCSRTCDNACSSVFEHCGKESYFFFI
jgi:hypothetical protein